jgi:pilus assembly protein Flp/PilA
MLSCKKMLVSLWKDEDGLETVEYAIAGGLIAAAVVAAFTHLGEAVNNVINWLYAAVSSSSASGTF